MARPRFADGGDGLQILRTAANVLNKHSRSDKRSSYSLGVGRGVETPHRKKTVFMKYYTRHQTWILGWRAPVKKVINLRLP
jgi:hypothetical protein